MKRELKVLKVLKLLNKMAEEAKMALFRTSQRNGERAKKKRFC